MFRGAIASGFSEWETPLGKILTAENGLEKLREAHTQEHSIEVQLPFLQTVLKKIFFTPLCYGQISAKELAQKTSELLDDETVLIVSSDFSHYYSYEDAKELDAISIEIISSLDLARADLIDACGKTGIHALMIMAKEKKWKPVLLEYRNSGDTAGDKERVVGYAAFAFVED
jgi:MEMO1 family protein